MYKLLISLVLLMGSMSSFAQYYDTLPKGVRLFMNRYIQSDVKSSYNNTQSETPFAVEIEANIDNLQKIDVAPINDALKLLEPYPNAKQNVNFGTYKIDANAVIKVNAYAMVYGITDRVSAYVGVPVYDARVNLKYKKVKPDTLDAVADSLQNTTGDDLAQTLGNIVENLYEIDGSLIQSGVTNALGYNELGSWEAQGLGDTELGIMYNFLRENNHGMMVTFGAVAPTGYVDDPDILQDIGFGDGQWDAFAEFGGGYIHNDQVILNAWSRYTYQFASQKRLRSPLTSQTSLSPNTQNFTEKLGNKIQFGTNADLHINDWFQLQPGFIFDFTEKAQYDSNNSAANRYLAENSESSAQNFRLMARFSSLRLFQQKKFVIPAQLSFSYQHMLNGQNTPRANFAELEFRMYF